MKDSLPENEQDRLAGLRALDILDTPAEERFDRITRLACRLFDAPFSMVTFIEEERQWFKSAQGHLFVETPRVESFCQYTLLDDCALLVEDAASDSRYFDLPAVFDMGIRFYAGVPIRDSQHRAVGTLCVLDVKPRKLESNDGRALEDLARCVQSELKLEGLLAFEKRMLSEMDELRRKASIDHVTRCWNASTGLELLSRIKDETPHDARYGLGVLLLSLEKIVPINQNFGEEIGDQYLREIANRIRTALPDSACLARAQAASFLVILPQLFAATSRQLCEDLVTRLCRQPVQVAQHSLPVEVCGGLALYSGAQVSLEDLVKKALSALYQAKQSGRASVKQAL